MCGVAYSWRVWGGIELDKFVGKGPPKKRKKVDRGKTVALGSCTVSTATAIPNAPSQGHVGWLAGCRNREVRQSGTQGDSSWEAAEADREITNVEVAAQELAEDLEATRAGLLRVELGGQDVALLDRAGELDAVVGRGHDPIAVLVGHRRHERVHEVKALGAARDDHLPWVREE